MHINQSLCGDECRAAEVVDGDKQKPGGLHHPAPVAVPRSNLT